MRDRVEVFRQIGVDNVGIAPAKQPVRFLDGVDRAATRPIAISAVLEVRFEDRLQHNLGGGLDHPIPDRRDAERTFAAARLGDRRPPHRIGPIRLRNEFLAQARQPYFHARRVNLLEGHPVNARRSRIVAGQRIGVSKNVLAADLVVEQIEAESGLRLRFAIELSLQVPDLVGRCKAYRQSPLLASFESAPEVRALSSAGITRPHRSYDLSDSRPAHRLKTMVEMRPPTGRVSPDYPCCPSNVPCPLPRRTEQGHASMACLFVRPSPNLQVGRRPHWFFRGLLRLHSRYGPPDRSTAQGGLCHEASARP